MCSSRPRATQFTIPAMSESLGPLRSPERTSPLAAPAIEAVWRAAAAAIGFSIARTREAYATSDGRGTIAIGADDTLDADDAFAQLVFHELCHAITEGERAVATPDWGLDNVAEHTVREHACLRFGAHLAERFGLRAAMAPTTDYRTYYDALAADPLAPDGDPATPIAIAARVRFEASTWRGTDRGGAGAHRGARGGASSAGIPLGTGGRELRRVRLALRRRARRAGGALPASRADGGRRSADRAGASRLRALGAARRLPALRGLLPRGLSLRHRLGARSGRLEGACLIVREGHRFEIRREKERCAALEVGAPGATPRYACTIYDNRPNPCREFAAGGRHCLDARRRVGLSVRAA